MQPLINPYYFPQPMYQQPQYQQTVPQVQPFQQNCTLNGKLIDNIESISANDVSMQGINVFPKNDLSEVYIKSWNPNGTIQTIRYLPYKAVENVGIDKSPSDTLDGSIRATGEVYGGIMQRLTEIENKLDKIVTPAKGRKATDESESNH